MFAWKKCEKLKKIMNFLTELCQDDVNTSSGDAISSKKLHGHVRVKLLWKITGRILEICYGSGVMQQNVGLWVNLPLDSMCVNKNSGEGLAEPPPQTPLSGFLGLRPRFELRPQFSGALPLRFRLRPRFSGASETPLTQASPSIHGRIAIWFLAPPSTKPTLKFLISKF